MHYASVQINDYFNCWFDEPGYALGFFGFPDSDLSCFDFGAPWPCPGETLDFGARFVAPTSGVDLCCGRDVTVGVLVRVGVGVTRGLT